MLWIPITIAAAGLQVARNALQRGLLGTAGPWGATLVRFLFGLPFALLFVGIAALWAPHAHVQFNVRFWLFCAVGGAAQMAATAALLVSMQRSSFALGTVFAQSGIPLTAIIALAFGESISGPKWLGLALTTLGLIVLGVPHQVDRSRAFSAAWLGTAAGAGFALSSNVYRQAALAVAAGHPVLGAQITLVVVQAMQAASLTAWLSLSNRAALRAVIADWRASLGAGFLGAAASGLWFTAFAMSPVAPVRAVGVVEMPIAAAAGRRMFAERLTWLQIGMVLVTSVGVALAALG